jgi:hypothetical protein
LSECKQNWTSADESSFSKDVYLQKVWADTADRDKLLAMLACHERKLQYQIFPPSRVTFHICGGTPDGSMKEGSVIVQHIHVGPATIEWAVRVARVYRTDDDGLTSGMRYTTLEGHPEMGYYDTFLHLPNNFSALTFNIVAYSSPATFVGKLLKPWVDVSRSSQRRKRWHISARTLRQNESTHTSAWQTSQHCVLAIQDTGIKHSDYRFQANLRLISSAECVIGECPVAQPRDPRPMR